MKEYFKDIEKAKAFVYPKIYEAIFESNNDTKYKYNQWSVVDINKLDNHKYSADIDDRWLSLIAFSGFASHRTMPVNKESNRSLAAYYTVRKGCLKYGEKNVDD